MNSDSASSWPTAAPELELKLNDITDLFNVPRVDSFSCGPMEDSGVSGVDPLLSYLCIDKSLQRASKLTLTLPADKAAAYTAASVTEAVSMQRHVNGRGPIRTNPEASLTSSFWTRAGI